MFSCWQLKGFGNGSEICLIQDFNEEMEIQGHLLIIANGSRFFLENEKILKEKMVSIAEKKLKERKREQAWNVKKSL